MSQENPNSQQNNQDELNLLVGRSLGQYRIVEHIGSGGMGMVFKGYQATLDRYVAIKVLPPYYARDPFMVESFVQESRTVAKLQHPNIVQIQDFGEQDNILFIVMEYVDGGTLKDLLKLRGTLSVRESVGLIVQAAEGLSYAHNHGIVHRDVKPSNMLLKNGQVLISDFGIAKILEGTTKLTRSGTSIGTPQYMSPEQGTIHQVDRRSDIYSLGIVFYQALTGDVPFNSDSPIDIMVKHLNDPLPVEYLRAVVPQPLVQVLLKMTAKHPQDRYSSMDSFTEALVNAFPFPSERRTINWQRPFLGSPHSDVNTVQGYRPHSQPNITYAGLHQVEPVCFRCGTANPSNRIFCSSCGYELSDRNAASDYEKGLNDRPILARLTFQSGQLAGRSFRFHQVITTIGRTNGNDLVISGRSVSRRHARLWFDTNRWYIADMQSANGTLVNNQRVQPNQGIPLNDGDVINFGDEIVVFNVENRRLEDLRESVSLASAGAVSSGRGEKKETSAAQRSLSLLADVGVVLEENDKALVGKAYALQVSVSENGLEKSNIGSAQTVTGIIKPVSFDVLIHESGNIELNDDWQKSLSYSPLYLKPEKVEFTFSVITPGKSCLVVDFYHERRWFKTVQLEFEAVEQSGSITNTD